MHKGEHLTREHQVNAKKGNRQYGVYSLQNAPLAEWLEDHRLMAVEIADELRTPELVEEYERQRVARGLVLLDILDAYLRGEE